MTSVPLSIFKFDKKNKTLSISSVHFQRQFPREFTIVSHHTNREIKFKQDTIAAQYAEFWDGEMMEYIPASHETINIRKVVIYHS